MDFAQEMLDDAAARQSSQPRSIAHRKAKIQWTQGDALKLPFADASFDAATMGYGLRNVSSIPQALKVTLVHHLTSLALLLHGSASFVYTHNAEHLDK